MRYCREVFRCYRQDVADSYVYCYNILNLEMLDILQYKLDDALRKIGGGEAGEHWPLIETCLHAYEAIAESIEWDNMYLPKFIQTLRDIPYATLHNKVSLPIPT